jgi:8-oxo-dGTP diphosphatase
VPPARFLVVVVFVIERDGHVLLLRRSPAKDHAPGEWETGSGGVESGETPEAAVVREAREETGLEVEVLGPPIDSFHYHRGAERAEAIGISFHCRALGGELRLSGEHDAARWIPLDRLLEADAPEVFRRAFRSLLARRA